ncbi:hypothetical protein AC1031_002402 [Aphanomyces cochlioides]|nr:hypothetical protein AC1031_002402 [Aphanomyces cochlioides]
MYNPVDDGVVIPMVPQATYVQPEPTQKEKVFLLLESSFEPQTFRLLLFHVGNLILAALAFATVVTLTIVGILLLPLCSCGLVVLRLLVFVVHFFARWDAYLYNFVASQDERITVHIDAPRHGFYHMRGYRIAMDSSRFSKQGFMAMFYFVGVKFPLSGLLSSAVLLLLIVSIQLLGTGVTGHDFYQGLHQEIMDHFHIRGASSIGFLVAGIGLLYLTIFFMHFFARILRLATKYFLCEYFATIGVVVREDSFLLHPLLVEPNGELVPHDVVVTPLETISN